MKIWSCFQFFLIDPDASGHIGISAIRWTLANQPHQLTETMKTT